MVVRENVNEAVWLEKNVDFLSLNEFHQKSRNGEGILISRILVKSKGIRKKYKYLVSKVEQNILPNISVIQECLPCYTDQLGRKYFLHHS